MDRSAGSNENRSEIVYFSSRFGSNAAGGEKIKLSD
jgi:hypothetical protein